MTHIDGVGCTWDFKDRLVEVEDQTTRTEYRYDFSDRRIFKRVWQKATGTTGSPQVSAVIYPNRHFEIREGQQPTKYIFDGQTRVARVIGSLSANRRTQHLRLDPGWNLRSLAVGETKLPPNPKVDSRYRWNLASQGWEPFSTNDILVAGSVLWIHATTNVTLALSGTYSDPTNQLVSAAGSFYPGAGLEAWSFHSNPSHLMTTAWHFDTFNQQWEVHVPSLPAPADGLPELLAPGFALFLRADSNTLFAAPDDALRVCYYHQDHLGSSSVLTDADGELIEETAFFPFGSPRHEHLAREVDEPYTFSQKERDAESRLHYFDTRYLAGPLARFITIDRKFANFELLSQEDFAAYLAKPQKLNLYAYCNNNPITFIDPDGRDEEGHAIGVSIQAEGALWGAASIEAGPTVFTPKASEFYKVWKYDIGLCATVGAGVGTPGGSVTANLNYNPGGRSSYEGASRTTSVSGGEGVVGAGSYSQTSGDPTIAVGLGFGLEGGPPVGVTHKKSYTKCVTVGDAVDAVVGAVTSPFRSVPATVPNISITSSRVELSISSRSVAYEEPPPPPRPRPKYTPPPPRQPRPRQECWTRGVPP
jgi:RHS repeat-associated protein